MKDTDTLLFIYLVFNVVFKHTGGVRGFVIVYGSDRLLTSVDLDLMKSARLYNRVKSDALSSV